MRKRHRKKKHLKEFREWGVEISISLHQDSEEFLYDFIDQAIEANSCNFGGGYSKGELSGMIELGKTAAEIGERLTAITHWLKNHELIKEFQTGTVVDLWNGQFE